MTEFCHKFKCPICQGMNPIIDRFNHSRFYDCPLCGGNGKIKLIIEIESKDNG
jgi:hypothetical protein